MKTTKLPLCIGRPEDCSRLQNNTASLPESNSATFSRFVLPFDYDIEPCIGIKSDLANLFYKINPTDNLSFIKRRKYLTCETGDVLYNRARWFDMCSGWGKTIWGKENVIVKLRDCDFSLGMLPPRIVLFEAQGEFSSEQKYKKKHAQHKKILKTGFLLVDVYFPEQDNKPCLDDLLHLNENFRYFGIPYDKHVKLFKECLGQIPVKYSNDHHVTKVHEVLDLECYFERWANLLEIPIKVNKSFYRLFPETWAQNARDFSYNKGKAKYQNNWMKSDDNRTYVWTAAFLKEGGRTLQKVFEPEENLEAKKYGHWHKLLNVDSPDFSSEDNSHKFVTQFERDWANERTYKRWESKGAWYGFSYHSGAVLAEAEYVFLPFSSYYFDTSMFLLHIRLSLFRFSSELSEAFTKNEKEISLIKKHFRNIRKEFLKFTIFYQYPMLSNQQQHVEMYTINHKYFDIEDIFREIKQEIDNTHEFFETIEANNLTKSANKIATWGIPIAVVGVASGFLWTNNFNFSYCSGKNYTIDCNLIFEILIVMAVFLLTYFLIKPKSNGE